MIKRWGLATMDCAISNEATLILFAQTARAIDAKKARRAEGRSRGFQAPQRKGAGKTLVLAKGGAADMEDDTTSTDSDY